MLESSSDGFDTIFAELQKMNKEVHTTVGRYMDIIQKRVLEAHHRQLHGLCLNDDITCDNEDFGYVLSERESNWEALRLTSKESNNNSERSSPKDISKSDRSVDPAIRIEQQQPMENTRTDQSFGIVFSSAAEEEIVLRWGLLVRRLLRPRWRSDPDSPHACRASLRPEWQQDASHPSRFGSLIRKFASAKDNLEAGARVTGNSFFQRFVIHPDSKAARWIMFLGAIALLYDVITVPVVMAFQIDSEGLLWNLYVARTIFWTLDMAVSALTGYYEYIIVEMRPSRTMMRYIRTWLFLDFSINVGDWAMIVLSDSTRFFSFLRIVKYLKFLRLFRALRVLRSVGMLSASMDSLTTEVMREILKLVLILSLIFLVNHYLACAWYGLAAYNSVDDRTWIQRLNLEDPSDRYMYIIAMHWTMTQFTPATNNVSPDNERERVFAFFVVVFALVMFSSFLGSLSSTITELKKMHLAKYQEEQQIRRFIFNRQVKARCAHAIWKFYRAHRKKATSAVTVFSKDVAFFEKLPRSIQVVLHEDINIPIITKHLALCEFNNIEHSALVLVCFEAAAEVCWMQEQEVFHVGTPSDDMFILNSGSVRYSCASYVSDHTLWATQIICEIAFWAFWTHYGDLSACEKCHVVKINAEMFARGLIDQCSSDSRSLLQVYAAEFLLFFNESYQCEVPFTDIVPAALAPMLEGHMTTITDDAFNGGQDFRTTSSLFSQCESVQH